MRRDLPGWFSAEVDWLVNCAAGEHGLRAVPLEPSMGGGPETLDDMHCRAATRAKRVKTALATLPHDWWWLLTKAHEYVCPNQEHEVRRHARIVSERLADLMTASASFRRAWVALGAVQGPRGVSA